MAIRYVGLALVLFLAGCGPVAKKIAPELGKFAVTYIANEMLHEQEKRHTQQKQPPRQTIQVAPAVWTSPAWDPQSQRWHQPNNVGGHLFWYADGTPAGLSAYHRPTSQLHYFDPAGQRVR